MYAIAFEFMFGFMLTATLTVILVAIPKAVCILLKRNFDYSNVWGRTIVLSIIIYSILFIYHLSTRKRVLTADVDVYIIFLFTIYLLITVLFSWMHLKKKK